MKIEVGKYYKTRDGYRVGPICESGSIQGWFHYFGSEGFFNERGHSVSQLDPDLIAEWVETPPKTRTISYEAGPVFTESVTTKRILPGVYGQIRVYDEPCENGHVCLGSESVGHHWTVTELTAAIGTLTAIRNAMAHNSAK